jgi:NADH-quinone oxidoreductase subunit M
MAGAVLYMLNHGIATGLLFLVIGMLIARGGSRNVADYGGVWKVAPVLGGVFLVATMATLALPGTNSFVSEFLVLIGTFQRYPVVAVIGTAGIILSAVYVLWIFQRTMTGPLRGAAVIDEPSIPADAGHDVALGAGPSAETLEGGAEAGAVAVAAWAPAAPKAKFGDLRPREVVVVAPLIAAIVFLGVYPKPVLDVIQPTVTATMSAVGASDPGTLTTVNGGGNR